jgi:signal transduction histidine kinase
MRVKFPALTGCAIIRRVNIFHKFLLIFFLATLLGIIAISSALSYLLQKNMIEEEARDTASLIMVLSRTGLTQRAFDYAAKGEGRSLFAQFAAQLTSLPEIIRVKIYDRAGSLVWSDEERLIGKTFEDNDELKAALQGKVQVAMGLIKEEHLYETEKYQEKRLLEVYVPLRSPDSGEAYAVLEIYKHPVSHFALMDRMRGTVWGISLAVGMFLFVSCSWLFRSALKEKEQLDRERAQVEAQLIHAEKLGLIGEMLAGLAHEINNPLSIMMSKVRLILRDVQRPSPEADLVQDLRVIDKNISRIGGIVRSLLTFSRRSNADRVPVNLNAIIADGLKLVEKPFTKMNIFFDQALDPSLPEVVGDGNQLQQVFLNLWSNARDAMQRGGRIWVRTYSMNHKGLWVVAEVRDSGQGISPEIIGRIFEPFFTTKGTREGAGLGLAVSYGIVKNHGGTIHVESQPGEGATFTLRFPALV